MAQTMIYTLLAYIFPIGVVVAGCLFFAFTKDSVYLLVALMILGGWTVGLFQGISSLIIEEEEIE